MFPAIDKMLVTESSDALEGHERLTDYSIKIQQKNKKAFQKNKKKRFDRRAAATDPKGSPADRE